MAKLIKIRSYKVSVFQGLSPDPIAHQKLCYHAKQFMCKLPIYGQSFTMIFKHKMILYYFKQQVPVLSHSPK